MSEDRASVIAAFLLTPRGRQLREPGARRLACARHCPGITAGEIARGIELAAETVQAEAVAHRVVADGPDSMPVSTGARRHGWRIARAHGSADLQSWRSSLSRRANPRRPA